jgi:selenocysteine-specific elongation factor
MTIDLILGTAGHIDHGKTALVKALTGVDTDRLPEEKKRGITIELGFAELVLGEFRLGIVDVPGHERFVRNMLAGATGIDLAMLVVAADDAIKPQTEEHLAILRLLELSSGVIALTKCDLADPEWIDLVEEEIRDRVKGTFLADAPLVRTSAVTGQGIDELRQALEYAARRAAGPERRNHAGPFRMAIDRVFTIAGHGTIVTGSVASGQASTGDELVVQPGEISVRVRGLQNHTRTVDEVHRGQRAAINLAGVHHDQFQRGHELASPGHLVPSRRLSVRLNLIETAPRKLKNRTRVRVHVGTAEIMAWVVLLDRDEITPGDWAPVQLLLGRAVVTTWNQPLVIRSESPVVTIGGGLVIDPDAPKLPRGDEATVARLDDLAGSDPLRRASAAVFFAGWRQWTPQDLVRTAGIDDPQTVCRQLAESGELVEIAVSPTRTLRVHRAVLDELSLRVTGVLEKMHAESPLRSMLDRSRLVARFKWLRDDSLAEIVLSRMEAEGRIRLSERGIALAGHGPQLSKRERNLVEEIVQAYRDARFQPPTIKQIKEKTERNQASVGELVELAAAEERLVKISSDYYLHAEVEREMQDKLTRRMAGGEEITVSQVRELLDTTRKYAVPFCEYLDRIGFTKRQGDVRVLADA